MLIDYEPKSPKHVPSKVRRLKVISSSKLRVMQPKVKAPEAPSSATAFGKPALFLEPYNQPIMQQPPLADPSPKLSIFPPYETRRPAPFPPCHTSLPMCPPPLIYLQNRKTPSISPPDLDPLYLSHHNHSTFPLTSPINLIYPQSRFSFHIRFVKRVGHKKETRFLFTYDIKPQSHFLPTLINISISLAEASLSPQRNTQIHSSSLQLLAPRTAILALKHQTWFPSSYSKSPPEKS